jgi:MFS family permease
MPSEMQLGAGAQPATAAFLWRRELAAYPDTAARRGHLLLVFVCTVALYYELYVGGGVAPLLLGDLRIPFSDFVFILAFGNLAGAFASLFAGLTDRMGRANLVVAGLFVVGLLTAGVIPNVHSQSSYALAYGAVAFVEGIILVATPALIRDFSPQVGRATALGFWAASAVAGSFMVSMIASYSLPLYRTWQSQYFFAGSFGLVVFVLALFALRELSPALRDQLMVSERDRALVEARAKGLDIEAALKNPWRQMMHADIIISALGVSVFLLFYITCAVFGTIYLTTVFRFTIAQANAIANWNWGFNAPALVLGGMLSDRLRVRKPVMLIGGIGACLMVVGYLRVAGSPDAYETIVAYTVGQAILGGAAYSAWMAGFTETVEARNPALTATGLAVWGWIARVVFTMCFLLVPMVITSVTPLVSAPFYLGQLQAAQAAHLAPGADLLAHLQAIQAAAASAPAQWRIWYWACAAGMVFFIVSIFTMRGRWSPAAAKADGKAHDAEVARQLALLAETGARRGTMLDR